jgi:hypothetical protein
MAGGTTLPDFKLYRRSIVTKTTWHKKQTQNQQNRKEDSEISSHSYIHLTFDKGTKNIHRGKVFFFKLDIHL